MTKYKDKCTPPPVLEINNQTPVCFHKVVVAGDDIGTPPKLGQYRNVILKYEGNGHVYIYSSDGIPTLVVGDDGTIDYEKLENKPLINGHELVGDSSLSDIGVNKAILDALKDYVKSNDLAKVATTGSYKDLSDTPTKVSEFENDAGYLTSVPTATTDTLGVVKVGEGLDITDGTLSVSEDVGALVFVDLAIASMNTFGDGYVISATPSKTFAEVKEAFEAGKDIRYRLVVAQKAGVVFAGTYELAPLSLHSNFVYAAFTGQSNDIQTAASLSHWDYDVAAPAILYITSMSFMLGLADVATSGSYNDLINTPTIGDATLTVQKNGTAVGSFKANATADNTINIIVPTTAVEVKALPDTTKYGASLTMSLNQTDYKITTTLKDQDGNTLGAAQTIDLPLESVVVGGKYDAGTKSIILTLQNGNTIDVPVGDLVAGLQTEITNTNKLSADLVDDTSAAHKFATSTQLTKIDELANIKTIGNNLTLDDTGKLDAADQSMPLYTELGENTDGPITQKAVREALYADSNMYAVKITGAWPSPSGYKAGGSSVSIGPGSLGYDMSIAIGFNAEARGNDTIVIGSSSSTTESNAGSILLGDNITAKYGVEDSVFLGSWSSATRNYEVNIGTGNQPGYGGGSNHTRILGGLHAGEEDTDAVNVAQLNSSIANFVSDTDYASADTAGVVKVGTGLSITDGVLSAAVSSLDWDNITNKPTAVSYWTNDAGYITSAALPTKVSQLTNDSNYITASANNLTNYYKKSETYTQSEVNGLLNALDIPTKTSELENDSGFLTSLPVASATTLGGVKVGNGLAISDGVLSATGISVGTITTAEIDTILGGI